MLGGVGLNMVWPVFADYDEKIVKCLHLFSSNFWKDMRAQGYKWFNNGEGTTTNVCGPQANWYGKPNGGTYGWWRWGN